MFQMKEGECVGFDSQWKVKKVSMENSAQTQEYHLKEIETQTCEKAEVEIQTDNTTLPDAEMEKVAEWLARIYPRVHRELNDRTADRIFKNYNPIFDRVDAHVKLLQTVHVAGTVLPTTTTTRTSPSSPPSSSLQTAAGDTHTDGAPLRVGALCWNCSGKVLAVSCNFVHSNWCHHAGITRFFGTDKNGNLSEKPCKKLAFESCVTSMQFHPSLQHVIAFGLYSGTITLWNINRTTALTSIAGHEDTITQISWIHDVDGQRTVILATSSLDGSLITWHSNMTDVSDDNAEVLRRKHKYHVKAPLFGRASQVPSSSTEQTRRRRESTSPVVANKIHRGVIAFDFSTHKADSFLVAVEGGLVVQCSTLGCTPLAGSTLDNPILDPVYKYYEAHEGEVQSINFSPNRREMFMTLGTLGEIRIYVLGQEEPAQVIFLERPLTSVTWIPYEEKLVGGCGEKGALEVFDILQGRPLTSVTKETDVLKNAGLMTQMCLNGQRPTIVVTGTNSGLVHVWNVPWRQFGLKL